MRHEIPDIKLTKNMKIFFSFLAILGLAYSIYVFTHVAEISGTVTEHQVAINKETMEATVLFKVNNKEFVYKDTVTELTENETYTDYKLANVNFHIGDSIKVKYKDAYEDQKPTYNAKKMSFSITSPAQVSFKVIEDQAMDLVEQYFNISLAEDEDRLKTILHPESTIETVGDFSHLDQDVELVLINPRFRLVEDTHELAVRENLIKDNSDNNTVEILEKNRSVYTFKFDGDNLKLLSVQTEPVNKK